MNARREALAAAVRDAAESFAREAYDLADLLERTEGELRGTGANPSPRPLQAGHREPAEPVRTPAASTMTSDEYRSAIKCLRLTAVRAANALGVSRGTHFRYLRGEPIPQTVIKLLRMYLRHGLPDDFYGGSC